MIPRHASRLRQSGLVWLGTLGLLGCTQPYVIQGRIDGLKRVAEDARSNGAYVCAPQELALATAQLEFAQVELDQGDQSRALEQHVVWHLPVEVEPFADSAGRREQGIHLGEIELH